MSVASATGNSHRDSSSRPKRACRNCVQIKVKCVPLSSTNGDLCERCNRLGKECIIPAPAVRKRARDKTSRVARLEERLNSLADFVTSASTATPPLEVAESLPTPSSTASHVVSRTTSNTWHADSSTLNNPSITYAPDHVVSPSLSTNLTIEEQDKLFYEFCANMNHYFPFVIIPEDTSTAFFARDKPFLFTSCVAAAIHRDPPLQKLIAHDMLQYVGSEMIVAGKKNLDLLQGLLVLLSWYQFYSISNPQTINLLHLCMALIVDLGFSGPPGTGALYLRMSSDAARFIHGGAYAPSRQSKEERRAFLAVYYLNSKYASCFRRLDHMRWTGYMEECLEHLSTNSDCPSDVYVVALVRIHRLAERYLSSDGTKPSKTMPVRTYVDFFKRDFENLRQSLPAELSNDSIIISHIQSVQICLYETILFAECPTNAQKLEALYDCLVLVNDYLNTTLSPPAKEFPSYPLLTSVSLVHALDVLAKLMFLTAEGWDLEYVRSKYSFDAAIERVAQKYSEVHQTEQSMHPDKNTGRFALYKAKLSHCREWYANKIAAEKSHGRPQGGSGTTIQGNEHAGNTSQNILQDDFTDSLWVDLMREDWNIDLPMQ